MGDVLGFVPGPVAAGPGHPSNRRHELLQGYAFDAFDEAIERSAALATPGVRRKGPERDGEA